MSDASFAGYRRTAVSGELLRLDLNEALREPGESFRHLLLARLAERAWRRYPDMDGRRTRVTAAALYGWDAAGTLVGNGSNDLLRALFQALVQPGGTVVTLQPSFSMYPVLAERARARLSPLLLRAPRFAADGEALSALAADADLVVLASPNNPTGGELDESTFRRVLGLGRPVVWDAAYVEFANVDPVRLLREFDNLLVLRSLSKAWGLAGLRVGALLGSEREIARIAQALLPFSTGWLVDAAFAAAVELCEAGRSLVAETVAERERLLAAVARWQGVEAVPSQGNFFLLRRVGWSGEALCAALRARGVAVRDLAELDRDGFVRVTVGDGQEGDRLLAALGEVAHE